jgi:hypothetical protein
MKRVWIEFMDGSKKLIEAVEPVHGGRFILETETTLMVYGNNSTWPESPRLETWHYFPRCNVKHYYQMNGGN